MIFKLEMQRHEILRMAAVYGKKVDKIFDIQASLLRFGSK